MPRGGEDIEELLLNSSQEHYEEPGYVLLEDGTREWKSENDILHREDGPARIYPDGRMEWYLHGLLGSLGDNPAIVYPSGAIAYYREGVIHRKGAPALIFSDEDAAREHGHIIQEAYYLHGIKRRPETDPCETWFDGTRIYWEGDHKDFGNVYYYLFADGREELWDENQALARCEALKSTNLEERDDLKYSFSENMQYRIIEPPLDSRGLARTDQERAQRNQRIFHLLQTARKKRRNS